MPILGNFPAGGGSGGPGGLALAAVSDIHTMTASGRVYIKWVDPDDLVIGGTTLAAWGGTLLIRKAGSAPVSRRDGVVVVDSKVRYDYSAKYFCDSGLTDGVTYYYKFFPYTTSNSYTDSPDDEFTIVPQPVLLGNVSDISVVNAGNGKLDIKWTDPAATVVEDGETLATWDKTVVVVKAGSYATSPDESGAFRQEVTTRNAHTSTPLTATGLTNGTLYYISIFPVSTDNAANTNPANRATGTPNRFEITSAPAQSGSLTYDGTSQTPSWTAAYDANKMTMSVTGQINAGDYTAYATPKDDWCWAAALVEPGMADNLSPKPIPWSIGKKGLTVTATMANKVYNGSAITAPDSAVAKDGATTIGDVTFVYTWYEGASTTPMAGTPKNVGSYRLVVSIADSDLRYSGASSEISFQITAKPVTIIGLSAADKVYDGNKTATVNGSATINGLETGDTVTVTAGSAAFADKNVGANKTVTFSGYSLSGADAGNYSLSAQPASVTASISKKSVTVSGITASNKTYDGSTTASMVTTGAVFTGIVSGDNLTASCNGTFADANVGNSKTVTISNLTIGGASVGNYELAASGNQSTTTANITKATGTLTLNPTSVTLDKDHTTAEFTIGGNFDGTYTVASQNTSVATVALVSGKTYRVSCVGETSGDTTILVTPTGGSNYTAPAAKSVTVQAKFMPTPGAALNTYTWEEIAAVAAAGKGDDYWDVGNTKTIHVQGTVGTLSVNADYDVYIIGFNRDSANNIDFGTFKSGGKDVCLVDSYYSQYQKYDGTKYFQMNHWGNSSNYNTNYGGWAACDMRYDILGSTNVAPSPYGSVKTTAATGSNPTATCATTPVANTLMAALPSDLRAVMKPMTIYTDNKGNSSNVAANVTTTVDYLPLLAEFEIFGTRSYANQYEKDHQAVYPYYSGGNSKVKYRHDNTGPAAVWWERSACYDDATTFCFVYAAGGAFDGIASISNGLAPAFRV